MTERERLTLALIVAEHDPPYTEKDVQEAREYFNEAGEEYALEWFNRPSALADAILQALALIPTGRTGNDDND